MPIYSHHHLVDNRHLFGLSFAQTFEYVYIAGFHTEGGPGIFPPSKSSPQDFENYDVKIALKW